MVSHHTKKGKVFFFVCVLFETLYIGEPTKKDVFFSFFIQFQSVVVFLCVFNRSTPAVFAFFPLASLFHPEHYLEIKNILFSAFSFNENFFIHKLLNILCNLDFCFVLFCFDQLIFSLSRIQLPIFCSVIYISLCEIENAAFIFLYTYRKAYEW